jgi:cytochrome b5
MSTRKHTPSPKIRDGPTSSLSTVTYPYTSPHLPIQFLANNFLRGGEEVLLDVGGQDATEAFEDVGHSDEAREILEGLKVGTVKRVAGDPPAKAAGTDKVSAGPGKSGSGSDGGFGVMMYAVILLGGLVAYGAWHYMQSQDNK